MLIHKYREISIAHILNDTTNHSEIEEYYTQNIKLFKLNQGIVQVSYIIFPIEIDLPSGFKRKLSSSKSRTTVGFLDFESSIS